LLPCSLQSQLDEARSGEEALDAELEALRNRLKGLRGAKGQADSEYRNMQEHLRELQGSSKSNVSRHEGATQLLVHTCSHVEAPCCVPAAARHAPAAHLQPLGQRLSALPWRAISDCCCCWSLVLGR
jgi:hypothetical protein